MNNPLLLLSSGIVGTVLGVAFFWSLWATIQRIKASSFPAIWMFASFLLRFACLLTVLYFVSLYGGWQHVLVAMVGFTLARLFTTHWLRAAESVNVKLKP